MNDICEGCGGGIPNVYNNGRCFHCTVAPREDLHDGYTK